jgi:uncharacterized Zn-finger protein
MDQHLEPEDGKASSCRGKIKERMEGRKFKCEQCKKAYKNSGMLRRHVETFHEKISKFKCSICGKDFQQAGDLLRHIKGIHTGERVPCEDLGCTKTFTQADYMKIHYKNVHLGECAYKCPTCGEAFSIKSNLKVHVDNIHVGKRYLCIVDECNRTFGSRTNLSAHVKSVHEKERRFPCAEADCDFSAFLANDRKRHMAEVHGTEKPFLCTFRGCSYVCATKAKLTTHMKKAKLHEEDREVAKIIGETCEKILNPVQASCFSPRRHKLFPVNGLDIMDTSVDEANIATLDSPLTPFTYNEVHRSSDQVSSRGTKLKVPSSQVVKTSSMAKNASGSRLPLPSSKQLRS